eukprot:364570-Chlamydomonas_euryale.AAC.21
MLSGDSMHMPEARAATPTLLVAGRAGSQADAPAQSRGPCRARAHPCQLRRPRRSQARLRGTAAAASRAARRSHRGVAAPPTAR